MEQEQNTQDGSNRKNGGYPERPTRPVTIVSLAIIIFVLIIGGWWVFLGDHIADEAKRAEVWILAILNTAIFVVVAVQSCIYFRQAKALDRQVRHAARQTKISNKLAETALKQFEITDRPWLTFEAVFIQPLTFSKEGGLHTQIRLTARNVGRSVAVNTTFKARLVIPEWEICGPFPAVRMDQVIDRQTAVCKQDSGRFLCYAVFPGAEYTVNHLCQLSRNEVERGRLESSDKFSLYFVGCVDYQFVGHAAHHQTRFAYGVLTRNPNGLRIGEDIPVESLYTHGLFAGFDYAD